MEEKYLLSHEKKKTPAYQRHATERCEITAALQRNGEKTQWGGYLIPSQTLEVRTISLLIRQAWELLSNFIQILILSSPPHQTDCWLYLFVS